MDPEKLEQLSGEQVSQILSEEAKKREANEQNVNDLINSLHEMEEDDFVIRLCIILCIFKN